MKDLRWCCAAVALTLQLGTVSAQQASLLAPGARVRVVRPDPGCGAPGAFWCRRWKVVGTLASVDSVTVVVRNEEGRTENVPRVSGIQLDVSDGPGFCGGRRRASCVGAGLIGGAALGTLVGAVVEGEHWTPTPLPARLSLAPGDHGRFSLGLSMRF